MRVEQARLSLTRWKRRRVRRLREKKRKEKRLVRVLIDYWEERDFVEELREREKRRG